MSRFKKGQTVYMGRGDKMRELVVARVIDNPMLPIYQYSFEAPHDGFACGEQSIRATVDGRDLEISECYKEDEDDFENENATRINTIASAKRNPIMMDDIEARLFGKANIFFRPNLEFCEWLRDYANGRVIIDVGSGQGHLVRMLDMVGAKAMGIEPNFNHREWMKWRMQHDGGNINVNEILEGTVQQYKGIIKGLGTKVLLVFARPCHSNFVEEGIYNLSEGAEALYITVPENLTRYNDLGAFKDRATLVNHRGTSEDEEVVYSVIR